MLQGLVPGQGTRTYLWMDFDPGVVVQAKAAQPILVTSASLLVTRASPLLCSSKRLQ